MKKNILNDWFWNKLESCYPVTHTGNQNFIYFMYNEQYIRKLKLAKLNKQEIKKPNKVKGTCIFVIDTKNKLMYCELENVFQSVYQDYKLEYETKKSINDILHNNEKMYSFKAFYKPENVVTYIDYTTNFSNFNSNCFDVNYNTFDFLYE